MLYVASTGAVRRLLTILILVFTVAGLGVTEADERTAAELEVTGEEIATLTAAPHVPPPIIRDHATKVIVNLETREVRKRLADGVEYTFWTFGGDVPGRFIRVREGDLVEFHLHNHPTSKMSHNIDLHAATGPGGGAVSSFTAPGHSSTFSFKAINPGLYVYHCATAPVGLHIANGMYGLILVQPAANLPPVDREYYVMQSEFYTVGAYGEPGHQLFSRGKALREVPDYVVFNGSVGALVGDNAIPARTGERVRLYVGNAGPNLVSSFHVIGEVFDKVYVEGGTESINRNVQTTMIPAGGSAVVEMEMQVPGSYILVDHAIFRAFDKGALGMIAVEADTSNVPKAMSTAIYSGRTAEAVYEPVDQTELASLMEEGTTHAVDSLQERIQHGKRVYGRVCAACHQPDGAGVVPSFPPLAGSDFLNANPKRSIAAVLYGMEGEVVVNGIKYDGLMPAQGLTDEEIANVLTYVYSMWGNAGYEIDSESVAALR